MSYSLYIIDKKPFSTIESQIKGVACEVMLLMVELSIFLLAVDDSVVGLDESKRILIGWIIIGLTGAIILI